MLWYVYSSKGGVWIENSIGIVSDGSAMVALRLQGWGIVLELAAILLGNLNTRVGLAAKSWGTGVGLAATVAELTEYIWIWLL